MTAFYTFIKPYLETRNYNGWSDEFKKSFGTKGKNFLKEVAKRLELDTFKIDYNKAGFACSGDLHLMGMKGNKGIYISFNLDFDFRILYRSITSMQDYTGGCNNYMYAECFSDYDTFISKIQRFFI